MFEWGNLINRDISYFNLESEFSEVKYFSNQRKRN